MVIKRKSGWPTYGRTKKRRTYRRRTNKFSRLGYTIMNKFVETKKKASANHEIAIDSVTNRIRYMDTSMSLTQGDSYAGITGHWVNAVGLSYKFLLHNNATNANFIRFLILSVKQGAAMVDYRTGANLFEQDNGNVNLADLTDSSYLYRRIDKDKYRVLKDKIIRLSGSSDKDKLAVLKGWMPMKLKRVNFNGSATTPTTDNIVFIWLMGEGDDDVGTAETVEYSGETNFYYKDA